VKLFLIGRIGGITHWLEDAAAAFRAEGHIVRIGAVRRSWLNAGLEAALTLPLAARMAAAARRLAPDLMLVIGGFHAPAPFLEALAAWPGGPPLVGWVGDLFDGEAGPAARLYDLIAYTDTGLLSRHANLGFATPALFLPHAANLAAAPPPAPRTPRMVFVANATPGRRALVERIAQPIAIFGPGWDRAVAARHDVHTGRVAHGAVAGLYARHLAALNIRNEHNVLSGLNQRSFDPCLSGTPVVTDRQADIERCFEPGAEVVVYDDAEGLNAAYDRLRRYPEEAARIGAAGRRRVLADHGYGRRLAGLMARL
jgi:spore maturation protein CgeB